MESETISLTITMIMKMAINKKRTGMIEGSNDLE